MTLNYQCNYLKYKKKMLDKNYLFIIYDALVMKYILYGPKRRIIFVIQNEVSCKKKSKSSTKQFCLIFTTLI